jgi:hypothetical protein
MRVEAFAAKFSLIDAAAQRAGFKLSGKAIGSDIYLDNGKGDARASDTAEVQWTYRKTGSRPFYCEQLPALWRAIDRQAPGLLQGISPDAFQHSLEHVRKRFIAARLLSRADLAPHPALPEQLRGVKTSQDVIALLQARSHNIGWSREFRQAFDAVTEDRERLIHLFCRTVAECTGVRGRSHVLKLAAGTLTYVWDAFDEQQGLKQLCNNLEEDIGIFKPGMVLMAEPLAYIAALNRHDGSFVRNIERMINDAEWRRADFDARLHYCAVVPGRPSPNALARRVAVGRNIAAHLQRRDYLSEILCQDIGRAIEVYPVLAGIGRYRPMAEEIKEGILTRLANAEIPKSLRAKARALMQDRASA